MSKASESLKIASQEIALLEAGLDESLFYMAFMLLNGSLQTPYDLNCSVEFRQALRDGDIRIIVDMEKPLRAFCLGIRKTVNGDTDYYPMEADERERFIVEKTTPVNPETP